MNLEEYKGVFVFAQQVDNVVSGIAFELIGKGKELAKDLGTEVTAVLIGYEVKGLADELAAYGADRVIVVDDPELKEYRTEHYAHALCSVIEKYKPEIIRKNPYRSDCRLYTAGYRRFPVKSHSRTGAET